MRAMLFAFALIVPTLAHANEAITFLLLDRENQAPAEAASSPALPMNEMVARYAREHGISEEFANAVAHVESRHRCGAIGRAGERGIMQVKPATARSVGITGNLLDCSTGIRAGLLYLKLAIDRAGGENCYAASLYNRGIYAPLRCTGYGQKIVALAG